MELKFELRFQAAFPFIVGSAKAKTEAQIREDQASAAAAANTIHADLPAEKTDQKI